MLVAVDCAQESRIVESTLRELAFLTVNIDHHHDNSRFGDVDLVVEGASSTGEVLAELFAALGVALTPPIAEALYTAIVTDTGRFQYSNTTPKALRLVAELVEAGADVTKVFVEVYESTPFPKLKLFARALERATPLVDGRVVVSELVRGDFEAAGAQEPYSEGIIDHLRSVEGAELVALVRELPNGACLGTQGVAALASRRCRRLGRSRGASAAAGTSGQRASRPTSNGRDHPRDRRLRSSPPTATAPRRRWAFRRGSTRPA